MGFREGLGVRSELCIILWGPPSSRASHASAVWMTLRALETLKTLKTLKSFEFPLALVWVWASMKGVVFAGFGGGSVFFLFFLASFSGFSTILLQKKSKIVVSKHMM